MNGRSSAIVLSRSRLTRWPRLVRAPFQATADRLVGRQRADVPAVPRKLPYGFSTTRKRETQMRFLTFVTALLLASTPFSAAADFSAITGWTGGTLTTAAGSQLYGWSFSVSEDIELTALGVYDDYGFVLVYTHDGFPEWRVPVHVAAPACRTGCRRIRNTDDDADGEP